MATQKITLTVDSADASGALFARGWARIVPSFTRLGDTADQVTIEAAPVRVTFDGSGAPSVDLFPSDLAAGSTYTIYYDRCPGNPAPWSFQLLSANGTAQRLSGLVP